MKELWNKTILDSVRAGHALNPLEKRRQMVAAQLAISGSDKVCCEGVILLTWTAALFFLKATLLDLLGQDGRSIRAKSCWAPELFSVPRAVLCTCYDGTECLQLQLDTGMARSQNLAAEKVIVSQES